MSPTQPQRRFARIVVACDPRPPGSGALEAAAALAASLQAELAGLFVEDVNLLRMAALPFTRELGLASALARPIDPPDIEREFRRHADEVRKALESVALASSVRWSFQVIRGQPLSAALSAARDEDLLVVGAEVHPGAHALAVRRSQARHEPKGRARETPRARPVAVIFDGSEQAAHALQLAAALARQASGALVILVAAADAMQFSALREDVRAALAGTDATAKVLWWRGRDLPSAAEAFAGENPAVLVWHDALDSEQLAVLLAAVRCPLVLAR